VKYVSRYARDIPGRSPSSTLKDPAEVRRRGPG